jgi:hypothetical protein
MRLNKVWTEQEADDREGKAKLVMEFEMHQKWSEVSMIDGRVGVRKYLLVYYATDYMGQYPPYKADSCSPHQEVPRHWWNTQFIALSTTARR